MKTLPCEVCGVEISYADWENPARPMCAMHAYETSMREAEGDTSEDACTDHGYEVCPDCGNAGIMVGSSGYVNCTRFLTCWTDPQG